MIGGGQDAGNPPDDAFVESHKVDGIEFTLGE